MHGCAQLQVWFSVWIPGMQVRNGGKESVFCEEVGGKDSTERMRESRNCVPMLSSRAVRLRAEGGEILSSC